MPRASKAKTDGAKRPNLTVVEGGGKTAGPGHNSDDTLALTMHHKSLYVAALAKKKAADADLKNVCKTIKAELGAVGLKDIKTLLMLDDLGENSAIKNEIEQLMRCAAWAGMPIGAQGSLFDEDRRTLEEKAADDGKYAGLNAKPAQSPHQPGSDLDQIWLRNWHDGQAELRQAFVARNQTQVLRPEGAQTTNDDDDAAAAADADEDAGDAMGEDECDVRPRFLREAEAAGDR